MTVRYAYALTAALLLGGAAVTVATGQPAGAQTAQNEPGAIAAAAPRAGAPLSFAELVARLQPAVVNISTTQRVQVNRNPFAGTPFGDLFGGQGGGGQPVTREAESLGSGFIISADGYVVTNNHVISAGSRNAVVEAITVTLADRREFRARLVARDPASDLAVLKIEGANFPFVRFGDSRQVRAGDWIVAIGNPFGLGGSVTAGIVSAVNRVTGQSGPYDRFIQTDASINRGNSGGPMFDLQGNVIGINSQILSPTGVNIGIGFAIPAEQAKPIVDTLMRGQQVQRGYLGVGIQPITNDIAAALNVPRGKGELVGRVEPGQAAARAGIRQGDIILSLGGKDVTPDQTLSFLAAAVTPGTTVPVEVLRDGQRLRLNITVGRRPSEEQLAANASGEPGRGNSDGIPGGNEEGSRPEQSAAIGLATAPLTADIARSLGIDAGTAGVVVVGVDPSSDAASKGLQRGDIIQSVNRQNVRTPAEINTLVQRARAAGREQVLLYVQRPRGGGGFIAVDIQQGN